MTVQNVAYGMVIIKGLTEDGFDLTTGQREVTNKTLH